MPACDLTEGESDIEISDSDDENQERVDPHADDNTENLEHNNGNREEIGPQIEAVENREIVESDPFSGSIQFVRDPVIIYCSWLGRII